MGRTRVALAFVTCVAISIAMTGGAAGRARCTAPKWESLPAMPNPRTEVASAAAGSRIFVIGGLSDTGPSRAVDVFDTVTREWSAGPALPVSLNHASAVSVDGSVYVLGGYLSATLGDGFRRFAAPSDLVFQLRDSRWEVLGRMPEARAAAGAAVLGQNIYLVGGGTPDGLATETLVLSTDSLEWSSAPGLNVPREHLGVTAMGGRLFAVGGRTSGPATNLGTTEIFDPNSAAWRMAADLGAERGGLGATSIGGAVVVAGGESVDSALRQVEAYQRGVSGWTPLPDLPTPRHGLALQRVGGSLYAIGGGVAPNLSTSSVNEALDPRSYVRCTNGR